MMKSTAMKIKHLKTVVQAALQLVALGALTLGLGSAAQAGSWTVTYDETLTYDRQGIEVLTNSDGSVKTRRLSTKVMARDSAQGSVITAKDSDGETRVGQDGDYTLSLGWAGSAIGGFQHGQLRNGVVEGHSSGKKNVQAIFHWHRQPIGDSTTPDPNDNPPTFIYVREHGHIGAYEKFDQGSHPVTTYNAQHPFKGTQFTFDNPKNSLGGTFAFDISSPDFQSAGYSSDATKVTCIKTGGREEVTGPDRYFSGSIGLNTSYGSGDLLDYDRSAYAFLGFEYSAQVVEFSLFTTVPRGTSVSSSPLDQRWVAYLKQDYHLNDPALPFVPFWSGNIFASVTGPSVTGTSLYDPPVHEWNVSGGTPYIPSPHQDYEAFIYLPDAKMADGHTSGLKDFHLDFGANAPSDDTTVSVIVTGPDNGDVNLKAKAKVKWYLPRWFVTKAAPVATIFGAHDPDKPDGPVDPDNNPNSNEFVDMQTVGIYIAAREEFIETGATLVKAGLEVYVEVAKLPFYEVAGAGAGQAATGLVKKIADARQFIGEATQAVTEAKRLAQEGKGLGKSAEEVAKAEEVASRTEQQAGDAQKFVDDADALIAKANRQNDCYNRLLGDDNRLHHIFDNPEHDLGPLLTQFGDQAGVCREVVQALGDVSPGEMNASGVFDAFRNIAGRNFEIRGRVINGITYIADFWVV